MTGEEFTENFSRFSENRGMMIYDFISNVTAIESSCVLLRVITIYCDVVRFILICEAV